MDKIDDPFGFHLVFFQGMKVPLRSELSKMLDQFQEELPSSYRSAPTARRSNYCPSCAVELVVQEFFYECPECHMVIKADDIQDVSSVRPPPPKESDASVRWVHLKNVLKNVEFTTCLTMIRYAFWETLLNIFRCIPVIQ